MEKYNLEKLVSVKVYDFYRSNQYVYLEYRPRTFWMGEQEAGIYHKIFDYPLGNDVPVGHVLIDKVVYEKPAVKLCFQGGVKLTKVFDSYEEAKSFANIITQGRHWLEQ